MNNSSNVPYKSLSKLITPHKIINMIITLDNGKIYQVVSKSKNNIQTIFEEEETIYEPDINDLNELLVNLNLFSVKSDDNLTKNKFKNNIQEEDVKNFLSISINNTNFSLALEEIIDVD